MVIDAIEAGLDWLRLKWVEHIKASPCYPGDDSIRSDPADMQADLHFSFPCGLAGVSVSATAATSSSSLSDH